MFKGPKNLFELSWNSRNWVFEFSRVNCIYTTFCNYITKTEIDRKLRPQATYDRRNVTVSGKFFRDIMKAIHDVIFRFSVSTGFGAIFRSDSNRIWFTSLPFVSLKLKVGFKNLKKNLCTKVLTNFIEENKFTFTFTPGSLSVNWQLHGWFWKLCMLLYCHTEFHVSCIIVVNFRVLVVMRGKGAGRLELITRWFTCTSFLVFSIFRKFCGVGRLPIRVSTLSNI